MNNISAKKRYINGIFKHKLINGLTINKRLNILLPYMKIILNANRGCLYLAVNVSKVNFVYNGSKLWNEILLCDKRCTNT